MALNILPLRRSAGATILCRLSLWGADGESAEPLLPVESAGEFGNGSEHVGGVEAAGFFVW